jgi:hypothetical protein
MALLQRLWCCEGLAAPNGLSARNSLSGRSWLIGGPTNAVGSVVSQRNRNDSADQDVWADEDVRMSRLFPLLRLFHHYLVERQSIQ